MEWTPTGLENFLNSFLSSGSKDVDGPLTPGGNFNFFFFFEILLLHVLTMMHVNLPYLGRQKKFGEERPFTREGTYLVIYLVIVQTLLKILKYISSHKDV